MHMLLWILLLSFGTTAVSTYGGQFTNQYDALVTTDGHEYQRVRPQRIDGNQLVFFHSSGIGRADLSVLPDNILADIGLPTWADRLRQAKEQAQLEAEQRRREDAERLRQQNAEKEEAEAVSHITFLEFDKVFNEKSEYTELQKQEAWKYFKGKRVQWQGVVGAVVGVSSGVNLVVRMSDDLWGTGRLLIHLKRTEKDKAMTLKENDAVIFRATLRDRTFSNRIVLADGEMVAEVDKGTSGRHETPESRTTPSTPTK